MNNNVIVALDGMSRSEALALAKELSGHVWGFKVNDLLLDCGVEIISELSALGGVFADPKLHDIPNTVKNSVAKIAAAGADLITVHGSAGPDALQAAVSACGNSKILAITVLTSHSAETAKAVFRTSIEEAVLAFAKSAAESGVHGVVCSPKELGLLSEFEPAKKLLKVTPGVRPEWYQKADDQSRVMTPKEAVSLGADYLVIGRPIAADAEPVKAADRINEELAAG